MKQRYCSTFILFKIICSLNNVICTNNIAKDLSIDDKNNKTVFADNSSRRTYSESEFRRRIRNKDYRDAIESDYQTNSDIDNSDYNDMYSEEIDKELDEIKDFLHKVYKDSMNFVKKKRKLVKKRTLRNEFGNYYYNLLMSLPLEKLADKQKKGMLFYQVINKSYDILRSVIENEEVHRKIHLLRQIEEKTHEHFQHVCQKYNICRSSYSLMDYCINIATILQELDDAKLKIFFQSFHDDYLKELNLTKIMSFYQIMRLKDSTQDLANSPRVARGFIDEYKSQFRYKEDPEVINKTLNRFVLVLDRTIFDTETFDQWENCRRDLDRWRHTGLSDVHGTLKKVAGLTQKIIDMWPEVAVEELKKFFFDIMGDINMIPTSPKTTTASTLTPI